jgi:hypothetical protein
MLWSTSWSSCQVWGWLIKTFGLEGVSMVVRARLPALWVPSSKHWSASEDQKNCLSRGPAYHPSDFQGSETVQIKYWICWEKGQFSLNCHFQMIETDFFSSTWASRAKTLCFVLLAISPGYLRGSALPTVPLTFQIMTFGSTDGIVGLISMQRKRGCLILLLRGSSIPSDSSISTLLFVCVCVCVCGIEFRVLCLKGRCCTIWATPPAFLL